MYDHKRAAQYWGTERFEKAQSNMEAVGYLSKPHFFNQGYTVWEQFIIRYIISQYPIATALDMACGVGRLLPPLIEQETIKKIYAVDVSERMLTECRNAVAQFDLGSSKTVEYIHRDSTDPGLPAKSLDFVMCMGLFEHLPLENQLKTLDKIYELLVEQGVFLLEINNAGSVFLRNKQDNDFRKGRQLENGYFCTLVDSKEIFRHLQHLGFTIIAVFRNPIFSLISAVLLDCYNKDLAFQEESATLWTTFATNLDTTEGNGTIDLNSLSNQLIIQAVK